LQKWGGNLQNNTIALESDLHGLTRPLNRDLTDDNNYKTKSVSSSRNNYSSVDPFVQESRASHPAWMYKDLEQPRWESPLLNPLNGLEKGFHENIQTRLLEKDNHVTKLPVVNGTLESKYYLADTSICITGKEDGCRGTFYSNR